ncbi:hypothetical protein AAHB52_20805 [Bacillus toyonensis]
MEDKRIVAFIPIFEDETDITSLKLKLWIPNGTDVMNFKSHYFSQNNFEVVKIVWRGDSDIAQKDSSDAERVDMNYISSYVAQVMEEKNIHGFCFTSRSYPELDWPYPNALIIVGMNPYGNFYKNWCVEHGYEGDLDSFRYYSFDGSVELKDLIEGLKLEEKHVRYLENLHMGWNSNLINIGTNSLRFLLRNMDGKHVDFDYGFFTLKQYWSSLQEYGLAFNYDIFSEWWF